MIEANHPRVNENLDAPFRHAAAQSCEEVVVYNVMESDQNLAADACMLVVVD